MSGGPPVGSDFEKPAILRAENGPQEGLTLILRPGDAALVGRRGADLCAPDDAAMSAAHFSVEFGEGGLALRDPGSTNGSYVNGERASAATLAAGDRIDAGRSEFSVSFGGGPAPITPAGALKALRSHGESLYVILDSARDGRVLELLRESCAEWECLYEGGSRERLADCAPYLARPAGDPDLLDALVEEGWGRSWGVYFSCALPLDETRRHLRKFLLAEVEQRQVYFRYYDPRVLRIFLPTCAAEEARAFFGPIETYLAESDGGEQMLSLLPGRRRYAILGCRP